MNPSCCVITPTRDRSTREKNIQFINDGSNKKENYRKEKAKLQQTIFFTLN